MVGRCAARLRHRAVAGALDAWRLYTTKAQRRRRLQASAMARLRHGHLANAFDIQLSDFSNLAALIALCRALQLLIGCVC